MKILVFFRIQTDLKEDILNTAEYGNIPQNRERIYIVGFRTKEERDKFLRKKELIPERASAFEFLSIKITSVINISKGRIF